MNTLEPKVGDIVRMARPDLYGERGIITQIKPSHYGWKYQIRVIDGGDSLEKGREDWWSDSGFDEIKFTSAWNDEEFEKAEEKWRKFFT